MILPRELQDIDGSHPGKVISVEFVEVIGHDVAKDTFGIILNKDHDYDYLKFMVIADQIKHYIENA
jgi:hypothetical protein